LLGYTQKELTSFFKPCMDRLSEDMKMDREILNDTIRRWYDGYKFTARSESVYNPFSIVKLFEFGEFKNFWFETATPTFLTNLIREKAYPVPEIGSLKLGEDDFSVYDIEDLQIEPLLFQTGYLTIRGYDDVSELYSMGYPNQEVSISFLTFLFKQMARFENRSVSSRHKLLHICLAEKRLEDFIEIVQSIMAAIPYAQIANQDDAYFHTVFYLMLAASGMNVQTEVLTSRGRIDLVMELDDKIYITELKCNHSSKEAIRQIMKKKYYEKYLHNGKQIYLLGINFNAENRTIDDWQYGELGKFLNANR